MIIWLILFILILFDIAFSLKYTNPRERSEKTVVGLFWLFFINYIPLKLFEVYQNDFSLYLKSFEFALFESINFVDFLISLWSWFLNFLQYSSSLNLYGFWASGLISLVLPYDNSQLEKAYWSCFFGMINPLFFLLYNNSAGEKEYFIMYSIAIFIFTIKWIKFKSHNVNDNRIRETMGKYFIIIIIITILFPLKQFIITEIGIFNISSWCFTFCLYFWISLALILYYLYSLFALYSILAIAWATFKNKNQNYLKIEANMWKICKFSILNLFFLFSVYPLYNLITALWEENPGGKELIHYMISGAVGYNLIFPEDGDIYNGNQATLNSISIYCQIWAARIIFSYMY